MAKTMKKTESTQTTNTVDSVSKARNKIPKIIPSLDDLSDKLLSLLDSNYTEITDLDNKNNKFQEIINRELDVNKGYSHGSIIDFTRHLNNTTNRSSNNYKMPFGNKDPYAFFSSVAGDLFTVFQDYYKNKYIEIQDLKFISKFIPALGEAINTTNDYIASADDMSSSILRNIELPASLSDDQKRIVTAEIEKIESKYNLQKKLKSQIFKNTLVSGTTYVYAIPYSKLFSEFSKIKAENTKQIGLFGNMRSGTAGAMLGTPVNSDIPSTNNTISSPGFARESFIDDSTGFVFESCISADEKEDILKTVLTNLDVDVKGKKNLSSDVADFTKVNYSIPYPVLENLAGYESFQSYLYEQDMNVGSNIIDTGGVPDVVKSPSSSNTSGKVENFDKIDDVYFKILDFKKIIPIKIFDNTIGYYFIHADKKKLNDRMNRTVIPGVLNTLELNTNKKERAVRNMVDAISNHIIKEFSLEFVTKNEDFKSAIADCIIYNGITDKNYKIQFIPAEDIIEFKINEDADGNGTSLLADALFPAKMLLSILVSKHLNYINKAGDKTIIHSYKNSIDPMTANHTQRIIRNIQESNANFTDILSTNILFSKVGRNSNIHIPQSRDGKKLVEFEKLEGQNIELNTEYEKFLEQMAIMATRVPSVIMEYVNQIDFAKQITTANIKFAGTIASLQNDLEKPTTDLYYRMLMASSMDQELKKMLKDEFKIVLPKPKILSNTNFNEYISNMQQLGNTLASIMYGENSQNNAEEKDEFVKYVVQNAVPLDWSEYETAMENIRVNVKTKKKQMNDNGGGGDDNGGY